MGWFSMRLEHTYFLRGNPEDLSKVCECTNQEMCTAIFELAKTGTADVAILHPNGSKTLVDLTITENAKRMQNFCANEMQKMTFEIVCRRIRTELSLSEIRKEAAEARWQKPDAKPMQKKHAKGSASAYASAYAYDLRVHYDLVSSNTVLGTREREKGERKAFQKPTLEMVKMQGAKIGLPDIECEKFFNHYEANGWKVGKNPMRSLNGAVAGWKLRWQERGGHIQVEHSPGAQNGTPLWRKAQVLEEMIEKHTANKSSRFFNPKHTAQEKEDYEAKKKLLQKIKNELAK